VGTERLVLFLFLFPCPCRRREERPRVQGGREENRGGVGPVGEVGGARVLPLRRPQHRAHRARRRAADTAGVVQRPPGVPRGAHGGPLALHCGVRQRRRREAVRPAAAHAMPHRVRTIDRIRSETAALIIAKNALCSLRFPNCSCFEENSPVQA
jgi:hypothetical protein